MWEFKREKMRSSCCYVQFLVHTFCVTLVHVTVIFQLMLTWHLFTVPFVKRTSPNPTLINLWTNQTGHFKREFLCDRPRCVAVSTSQIFKYCFKAFMLFLHVCSFSEWLMKRPPTRAACRLSTLKWLHPTQVYKWVNGCLTRWMLQKSVAIKDHDVRGGRTSFSWAGACKSSEAG